MIYFKSTADEFQASALKNENEPSRHAHQLEWQPIVSSGRDDGARIRRSQTMCTWQLASRWQHAAVQMSDPTSETAGFHTPTNSQQIQVIPDCRLSG